MAFIDARQLQSGSELAADVCIVGAGPAGISLATELSGTGLDVLVLESGGLQAERRAQSLSRGERRGNPYPPLERARVRAFGGSSRHWPRHEAMMARPLEPFDLERREGHPYSGWPFDHAHLQPFYRRAHELAGITTPAYDLDTWAGADAATRLALASDVVGTTVIQSSPRDAFVNAEGRLRNATDVTVALHSTVTGIATSRQAERVSHLIFAADPRRRLIARARVYVLAAGGIENPRLLLVGNDRHPHGIGNGSDLVGRFFMEHLWLQTGRLETAVGRHLPVPSVYELRHRGSDRWRGVLALREEVRRRENLLNGVFFLDAADPFSASPAAYSLAALRRLRRQRPLQPDAAAHLRTVVGHPGDVLAGITARLGRCEHPGQRFVVKSMSEQAPNPASRVTLARRRDRFGLPAPRLEWRPTASDIDSVRRAQDIIAREVAAAGIGELTSLLDKPAPVINGTWHHMGTTRMDSSPRHGVVDADGRVHGIRNLYVTGSSVFPSAGYVNPTLTIVALAVRLAHHLARVL